MVRFRPRSDRRFRTHRASRRRSFLSWWSLWRVPTLVTLVAALWWFAVRPLTSSEDWVRIDQPFSLCGEGERTAACVIDGDTVLIASPGTAQRRIRLTGFDAPELDGACDTERALAEDARRALLAWLSDGPAQWSGADDPPYDKYGRELREVRRIRANGSRELLADRMITSGLAAPTGWETQPRDWCR